MRAILLSLCFLMFQFSFAQSDVKPIDKAIKIKEEAYKVAASNSVVDPSIVKENSKKQTSAEKNEGMLTETKDERIDLLIQDYMDNKKTMGYRVQLFAGSSKWEAVKTKSDFLKKFNNEVVPHVIYQSPNFKVRVGDFRNRLEAEKHLELYKIDYPSAFVVKDEIEIIIPD